MTTPVLSIQTRQRDNADPNGNAEVISEKVEEPERTDERKWNGEKTIATFVRDRVFK